jgi:hypothetical protein
MSGGRWIWKAAVIFWAAMLAAERLSAQAKGDAPLAVETAGYPEGSAERAALAVASRYLGDDGFTLRQDYWQGELTATAGKAVRLQFFPHTKYRLFLAAGEGSLPKGAKLHLRVMDRGMNEVAVGTTKFKSTVASLKFEPEKTGLYLVLMRLEAPEEADKEARVRCVLFYGYE